MRAVVFALLGICVNCFSFANIGPEGFSKYKNYYFIETGTYGGAAVEKARKSGFQEIRSIEYDLKLANHAQQRFKKYSNIKIYQGDSSKDLWDVIKDIQKPATFWLDAHIYPPRKDGGKNCPLMEELEQIKKHPIKTHTILIDDMHCCGTQAFDGLTKKDIAKKILEINAKYKISYVTGGDRGEYKDNVMVAIVP